MKLPIFWALAAGVVFQAEAGSTIDTGNRYAYGANIGWMDSVADTNNGAVIGDYVCSGYIYSANVGWINLGNGTSDQRDSLPESFSQRLWGQSGRFWQLARLRLRREHRLDQLREHRRTHRKSDHRPVEPATSGAPTAAGSA